MSRPPTLLLATASLACALTLGLVSGVDWQPLARPPSPLAEATTAGTYAGVPTTISARIRIPAIGVDAALESVGLTPDGEIGVPSDRRNAAWFNQSPRPGEKGIAIIDGHYGWRAQKPAVFDRLSELRPGNKIYVEDAKGTITVFVVRGLGTYDEAPDAPDLFTSTDGKAHLNLITCEGEWDAASQSYAKRLVVFADKV